MALSLILSIFTPYSHYFLMNPYITYNLFFSIVDFNLCQISDFFLLFMGKIFLNVNIDPQVFKRIGVSENNYIGEAWSVHHDEVFAR
jgi:hypothetical protein